jgi:predicted ATPase
MKILNLTVEGFRSLKNVSWSPGDLNVLIGPNGSGKSNLLKLLELISVSAKGELGKYVQRAGGMDALVWDDALDRISVGLRMGPTSGSQDDGMQNLSYKFALETLPWDYYIDDEVLERFTTAESGEQEEPVRYLWEEEDLTKVLDKDGGILEIKNSKRAMGETVLSLLKGQFTLDDRIAAFPSQISEWCIYQDQMNVSRDAVIRQAAVARHEERVDPDGQNLIPVLHTLYSGDRDFKKTIDLAMRTAFGNDYEELVFPPAADQRIQLRVRWKTLKRERSAADLSDGTLRFLFLLTVLSSPSPAPLIAIDEPETGLHPSMLPIIAEHAVDAAQRTQIIFTTHSPQFLDAFGDTRPTTTVAKWENGESSLTVLSGDTLDYWLKEYTLGSLFKSGELETME